MTLLTIKVRKLKLTAVNVYVNYSLDLGKNLTFKFKKEKIIFMSLDKLKLIYRRSPENAFFIYLRKKTLQRRFY